MADIRTDEEIQDVIDKASKLTSKGKSKFPGMSYEEGIRDALEWVLNDDAENPLDAE